MTGRWLRRLPARSARCVDKGPLTPGYIKVATAQVSLTLWRKDGHGTPVAYAEVHPQFESSIDELAYELGLDPLELRLRNYAKVHPQSGLPWSSNALRECYAIGAERFGWTGRNPEIGSMRDGHWKIGYGLAALSWSWFQVRCQARATITRDGQADVRSAASDPGTGTRTVMHQLSSERLGLPLDHVRFELGDSDMPWSPAPAVPASQRHSATPSMQSAAR